MQQKERDQLLKTKKIYFERSGGLWRQKTASAKILGIVVNTLWRKFNEYGINDFEPNDKYIN